MILFLPSDVPVPCFVLAKCEVCSSSNTELVAGSQSLAVVSNHGLYFLTRNQITICKVLK